MFLCRRAITISRKVNYFITSSPSLSQRPQSLYTPNLQYVLRCNSARTFATRSDSSPTTTNNDTQHKEVLEPEILDPPPQQQAPQGAEADIIDDDDGVVVPHGAEEVQKTVCSTTHSSVSDCGLMLCSG